MAEANSTPTHKTHKTQTDRAAAQAVRIAAAVRSAQLKAHRVSALAGTAASLAVAAVATVHLLHLLPVPNRLAWLATLTTALLLRLGVVAAHHQRPALLRDTGWLLAYRASAGLGGLVWGALPWCLPTPGDAQDQVVTVFLLSGLAAGGMIATLFDLHAALAFALPAVLPLALKELASPAPLQRFAAVAGVMLLLLLLFFTLAARRVLHERWALAAARLAEAERSEEARRAEALMRRVFDHVGEGMSLFDADWRLQAWNARFADSVGLPPDLLRVGLSLHDCLVALGRAGEYGDVDPEAEATRREATLRQQPLQVHRRSRRNGRTIEVRRSPTPDGGFVTVYVDITDRQAAEDALADNRRELHHTSALLAQQSQVLETTLQSLSQGVLSIDASGRVNTWNRRFLELLEVPAAFMAQRPTLLALGRWQHAQGQFGPALERIESEGRSGLQGFLAGDSKNIAKRYLRTKLDGTVIDVQSHFADDGSLVRTYTDVTAHVRAEQALRESESRFRHMADAAPALIWLSGPEGQATWFNQRWLSTVGQTMAEALAAPWRTRIHADDVERCRQNFDRAFALRQPYEIEFRVPHARGGWAWVADTGIPRFADNGGFEGFISYGWDITERQAAGRALVAAKEEAERANRAKSEFLSRMSHELRTPLNAILGFGQLLANDPQEPLQPRQRSRLAEVQRGGEHLLALINDVLDLSRIEAGALQMQLGPVNLVGVVEGCLRLVAPVAQERGITLSVAGPADPETRVWADATRLQQVLLNLLSNAIKYNREGGTVALVCLAEPQHLLLEVSDCGPGLNAAQQQRLFQAFERLDAGHTAVEGAGIGLALSKWLVELMHGDIGVRSQPGVGSTFWLRLRRDQAQAPMAASAFLASTAPTAGGTAATDNAAPTPETPPCSHVLYVEDNPVNQLLMEGMLAHRPGLRLSLADRPSAGLALATADRPDLVLLDIQLPEMDGYALLRELRALPGMAGVPVIAVSANAMPSDLQAAQEAGFDDYLTKPLALGRLLAVVNNALGRSGGARRGDGA